jgi:excinuclease ABC subunit A
VFVNGKSIIELCQMSIEDCRAFMQQLQLTDSQRMIAKELLKEIQARLSFLVNVGLGYLSLDRKGPTLSGGEAQRIRLASQIGSELTGVLYILDEPSIGLHQRDNQKLLSTLMHLRDLGNSLIVVEHDQETIEAADWIVDFGPGAGTEGGHIVASGPLKTVLSESQSLTGQYLSGKRKIEMPAQRRPRDEKRSILIEGAQENNLQNIDVSIPIGLLTAVTGVSGAGKSTLINHILYPALAKKLHDADVEVGRHKKIRGLEHIDKVINIDQKPIGRTPRSNPATYTKVFDLIRDFYAMLPESQMRGYTKGRFSFNVKGGRCEPCQGDGFIKVEMHFLADVFVPCEACKGSRFNATTCEILYKGHSIADILKLSVREARDVFAKHPKIVQVLDTLIEVGLSYISLGQSATTLSGGEAQRIKLARELAKRDTGRTLYVLDEPTTGLHFQDIAHLLDVIQRLVSAGNSVVVIEHNLDVIKCADWVIDIGPEGGKAGGQLVAQGTPEEVAQVKASHTGRFLKDILR